MFGGSSNFIDNEFLYYLKGGAFVLICATVFSLPVLEQIRKYVDRMTKNGSKIIPVVSDVLGSVIIISLFAISVITNVASSYNPFIYFNF